MRRRLAWESVFAVALLCVAAWLINVVAGQTRARIDLTADQRHTLSPVTLRLLQSSTAPIEARAYLPANVQPPHSGTVQATRDLLEEYRAASDGRFRVVWRDPSDEDLDPSQRTAMQEEAKGYGIEPTELVVTRGAKRVRQRVVFGVVLLHRDRHAVIHPSTAPDRLEHDITRALKEVLRPRARRPVIGVAVGRGEPDLINSPVAQLLSAAGDLQPVELSGDLIPAQVDVLLVLGPKRPFNERARYAIDQFLMHGGALVAWLDYRPRSEAFPDILVPTTTGLEPLLASYGLHIDHQHTVVDRVRNAQAPVSRGGQAAFANHPLYIEAEPTDHPVTRGLASLVVPLATPIRAEEGHPFAVSSKDSTLRANVRSLDPTTLETDRDAETPGPATVGMTLTRTLTSAFAEQPVPTRGDVATATTRPAPDPPKIVRGQGEARLLVVTSGARMLAAQANGLLLLQNAVDWALADTDLVAIRGRRAADPPLRTTSAGQRVAVKWGVTLVPPVLVLLAGVLRWRRRRGRA